MNQVRRKYPVLMFDKRRMQQVLSNLLSNAIKFTRKGEIMVSGHVQQNVDDPSVLLLTVSVADEGIGMSDEEIARVFDGRKVAKSSSLNPYSNGIGLPFCKKICQIFDGNISVISVLGQGSQFTFTMCVK